MPHIEEWLSALGHPNADKDYRPGHQRMYALLANITLRQPKLRIRVAGTNGKGSTSFMLAHALQACGFKVGLYTSPHIQHFRERIRVNLATVEDQHLLDMLKTLLPHAKKIGASYFETATTLALQYFSQQQVDIEILEAGVGARLDATTAVSADMAVITPIALDHMDWLGDNLTAIAQEKAHILHGCRYNISAPQTREVEQVLTQYHTQLTICTQQTWPNLNCIGQHQQDNASLAYAALQLLSSDFSLNFNNIKHAIQHTSINGRLQKITYKKAQVWLDAAHNTHAIQSLLPSLAHLAKPFDVIFCFSRADRDLSTTWPLLQVHTKKLITQKEQPNLETALHTHLKCSGNYLILGSFTTVDKALCYFKKDVNI